MKASSQSQRLAAENVIPLPSAKQTKNVTPKVSQRFDVQEFENRSGSISWRVAGSKRDGTRIRENFSDLESAQCRQNELQAEYLQRHSETIIRATRLTAEQVQLCEAAMIKLGDDWQRLLDAVDYWQRHGRQLHVTDSPRIDDAVEQFQSWLKNGCGLREQSKHGLRIRTGIFANSIQNMRVNEITPDTVEKFLSKLTVSPTTRDNYRRAVSRFFSWCIERPRRWTLTNPCREIRVDKREQGPPTILTVAECEQLLRTAEVNGLAPYVSVCLFAGLRPFEAARLTWQAVNLRDREIRLEGIQTKTGTPRVVNISDTLAAWLTVHKGELFFPSNWRRRFRRVQKAAGYGPGLKPWPPDVMRHTACSHYFRKTGSYGETAEQFGNSEAIIKKHYQGRVSSEQTKKFYALRLAKKEGAR